MAVLRILNYPDPRLRTVALPVENVHDPMIQTMIDDMLETLHSTPACGGLAATQLDIASPRRIFVFYDTDHRPEGEGVCVVNPEITATEGEVVELEGCMSVYASQEISMVVKRPARTTMRALNRQGEPIEMVREGYLAKLFQHETDHLNGKLCIDYLGEATLKRRIIEKKINKIRRLLSRQQNH